MREQNGKHVIQSDKKNEISVPHSGGNDEQNKLEDKITLLLCLFLRQVVDLFLRVHIE